MKVMASEKGGKKKYQQICVRLTDDEMDTLKAVIGRVIERSNGLATPDMSAIVKELAHLRNSFYVTDADREFIKSRMATGQHEGKKAAAA